YERFGVPAEIGLAQVIFESGLNGTRRSEANAVGFCQWLQKNWKRLNHFSPTPIEGRNQTTQAPYCAAYLSVLATKYGSFIPALSEHNAGGTNVGRTLINGDHISEFGSDVAFWRRAASPTYLAVLDDFLHLEPGAERWDDPTFAPVLRDFKRRFRETRTEEGVVMETVLTYVMDQAYTSPRRSL